MKTPVPQTASAGQSQSPQTKLAQGLGLFSIALGAAELLAPGAVCRAAGLTGHERLIRAYGAREVATGVAILMSHDPTPWIWGRVAGDVVDIATVLSAADSDPDSKVNANLSVMALAGVTLLDIICATGLTREQGDRTTAVVDYGDRSGYPRGLQAARGAADDVVTPRDMRGPDAIQPWTGSRPADARPTATTYPGAGLS
jgi:hypothetical protein